MMWNWLASGLASGATLLLYDGSPSTREIARCSTSAEPSASRSSAPRRSSSTPWRSRASRRASARPLARAHDPLDRLAARRPRASTTSTRREAARAARLDLGRHRHRVVLRARQSRRRRCVAARSRCRASAWRSRCSTTRAGRCAQGKGELVCTRPFPSMPIGFWNDPDGARYRAAYFERFPGVWHHGDFAELTEHGGMRHPRPLRRGAEPRRRADRHRGDLPPGRAARRGASSRSRSGRTGRATCAWCCSCGCATASCSTTRSRADPQR